MTWFRWKRWMPVFAWGLVAAAGIFHGVGPHITAAAAKWRVTSSIDPWEY